MELPRLLFTANCILLHSQSLFHIQSHHHVTVLPRFNYSFNPVAVFFCDACDEAIFKCATRPKILVQLSCSWYLCSMFRRILYLQSNHEWCMTITNCAWQWWIVLENHELWLTVVDHAWHSNQSCGDPSWLPIEYWHRSLSVSRNTSKQVHNHNHFDWGWFEGD